MTLYEKIEADMREALKKRDAVPLSVLRMLIASLRQAQIDKDLICIGDPDVLQAVQRHIKQRKESISQFESGNRKDLADKELAELKVLEAYMPKEMSEDELREIVRVSIAECGAGTKADMGKVMKLVKEKTMGCCDGKLASRLVTEALQ